VTECKGMRDPAGLSLSMRKRTRNLLRQTRRKEPQLRSKIPTLWDDLLTACAPGKLEPWS